MTSRAVPASTVARLPLYLRVLDDLTGRGVVRASSAELAELSGVGPAQLRRDLSFLGSHGVRGVGYDVEYLRAQVGAALGLTGDLAVVIVGIGNLGHTLANYMADVAQAVCDRLVAAGVTGVLTFVPRVLTVPAEVDLRSVDLATELQVLAFHARRRSFDG